MKKKQNQEKFVCLSEIGKILIGSIEICFSIIYLFQLVFWMFLFELYEMKFSLMEGIMLTV